MTPIERLRALARDTRAQYGTETAAGGEPAYPAWVDDVTAVCDELERLLADATGLMPTDGHPIAGRVWFRASTHEWVLELNGTINGTNFTCRHTEPASTKPEDVPGLPSLYAATPAAVQNEDELVSLGGDAPGVPSWLLDAARRIETYMAEHAPGEWAIGGIQKRQAAPQQAEPSDADLTALGQSVGLGPSLSVEFARALLARYEQTAASAEPIGFARPEDMGRHGQMWVSNRASAYYSVPVYAAPVAAQAPAAAGDALREAVKTAYGYLWHVNNEPGTPNQYAPERAAYEARKVLREQLTKDERGEGINVVRAAMQRTSGGDHE